MTVLPKNLPAWAPKVPDRIIDYPKLAKATTNQAEWGTSGSYVRPNTTILAYIPIAMYSIPIIAKGVDGLEFQIGRAYWNGGAANSKGLFPYTFTLPSGNYLNNVPSISSQHTRFIIPLSRYITGATDLENDLMS